MEEQTTFATFKDGVSIEEVIDRLIDIQNCEPEYNCKLYVQSAMSGLTVDCFEMSVVGIKK